MCHSSFTAIIFSSGEEKRAALVLVTGQLSIKKVLRSWYLCALSPRGGLKEKAAI